jgi:hypothetical protein
MSNKCTAVHISLKPQGGAAVAKMPGNTSQWEVTFDVTLAPDIKEVPVPGANQLSNARTERCCELDYQYKDYGSAATVYWLYNS